MAFFAQDLDDPRSETLTIRKSDDSAADPAFRADVLRGLAQVQKAVPARWFYDLRGSQLFEEITKLPEYYPTRTETALLHAHVEALAGRMASDLALIEFGS